MRQKARELWRKIAHVIIGTLMLLAGWLTLNLYGSDILDFSLAIILAILVIADILIADHGWKLPLYHQLQRKHEIEGLHTATLAVLSSIIVYKLFALPVAIAAIAMLIYGDAAAAIAGLFARKNKTFWKTNAMLVISVLVGYYIFGWIGISMGVAATIAERLTFKIDDAIAIPILAGLIGQIILLFL